MLSKPDATTSTIEGLQVSDIATSIATGASAQVSLKRVCTHVSETITSGNGLGQVNFTAATPGTTPAIGTSDAPVVGARIRGEAQGTWTSTAAPSSLDFYTCPDGSTTLTKRMRIAKDGGLEVDSLLSGTGTGETVYYNTGTKELSYGAAPSAGGNFIQESFPLYGITTSGETGMNTSNYVYFSAFTAKHSRSYEKVRFLLRYTADAPPCYAGIYSSTSTHPHSLSPNAKLGDGSILSTNNVHEFFDITFSSPIALTCGTTYFMAFMYEWPSPGMGSTFACDDNGGPDTNHQFCGYDHNSFSGYLALPATAGTFTLSVQGKMWYETGVW
jgi:hypothetical protein